MALNFPANTSLPYIDPISGLKYIYNSTVGAWEAAIQPPAIISSNPPAITIPGFLWWDDVGGSLYVYYKDTDSEQWVEAVPSGASKTRSTAAVSTNPPDAPAGGELWWDSENGRLYIWYEEIGGTNQWMQATTSGGGAVNPSQVGMTLHSGQVEPTAFKRGDLWFNTSENTLYAHVDGSWRKAHNINTPASSVTSLSSTGAVTLSGTATDPIITARASSTTETGVIRLSTGTEGNEASDKTTALSPGILKETISSYVDISNLATKAEVAAITPDPVPVGTVIEFAGDEIPTGYLGMDGSTVSRITYAALFQVIGTKFGIGDGATTFGLPTKPSAHTYGSCIKF